MRIFLLLLGALKFSKVFITAGSMLLSVFVYALAFGWKYSVGFVLLIFCHEMGHYIAARLCGLNVGAPTFIPFLGAWIELKDQPMSAKTEAYIGMAGPLVGSLAALACYFWARSVDSSLLLAISYSGFFINLFNLIPMPPLDGGRITAAISRKIWLIGAPLIIAFFIWRPNPLLFIIFILIAPQTWKAFKELNTPNTYYEIDASTRFEYGLMYFGLIIFLATMTHDVHEMIAIVQ